MRSYYKILAAAAAFCSLPLLAGAVMASRDYVTDGVFTQGIEGPAVDAQGNLYAVNFAREGTIGVVDAQPQTQGASARLFVQLPRGSTGNGIRFGPAGEMYVADYTGHKILRINPHTRAIAIHAHNPQMHQPNDIAIAQSGMLYASDPHWPSNSGQLWLITPDGTTRLLETSMGTTNGIEVSADENYLYVNESVQRRLWQYRRDKTTGLLSDKRLLLEFADHGLDGMRCDQQGNLYIARYGAGEIAVVSPAGELLKTLRLKGSKPTNVAFGGSDGRTLYVTLQDRGAIEQIRVDIPGREWGLWRAP